MVAMEVATIKKSSHTVTVLATLGTDREQTHAHTIISFINPKTKWSTHNQRDNITCTRLTDKYDS